MFTIKSEHEIEFMRISGQIVAGALKLAGDMARPGVTTQTIDKAVEQYILDCGALPSFKGYGEPPFPAATCMSVNQAVVHGIPDSYELQDGDILSVDVGAYKNGYHGDAARTFGVGQISSEAKRLIETTEQCFWQGVKYATTNNRLGDVSHAIEQHALDAGYSVVLELIGHGIGENLHEQPDVPNYGRAGYGVRLQKGMALAIEPMINQGKRYIELLDDDWTIVTQDGKLSAHYENTIIIGDGEAEILTLYK